MFCTRQLGDDCGVVFRKQDHCTLYELLRLPKCPPKGNVEGSYPELAVEIPNQVFDGADFRSKVAGFLSCTRIQLLTDMLRDVGHPVEPNDLDPENENEKSLDPEFSQKHVIAQFGKMKAGGRHLDSDISSISFLRMHRCSQSRRGPISEAPPLHSIQCACALLVEGHCII